MLSTTSLIFGGVFIDIFYFFPVGPILSIGELLAAVPCLDCDVRDVLAISKMATPRSRPLYVQPIIVIDVFDVEQIGFSQNWLFRLFQTILNYDTKIVATTLSTHHDSLQYDNDSTCISQFKIALQCVINA